MHNLRKEGKVVIKGKGGGGRERKKGEIEGEGSNVSNLEIWHFSEN